MTTKHIEGAETIRALKSQVEALTASQNVCGSGAGCLHKDALIEVLTIEREESDAVRDKLALLLAGVAIALKGPELPLHRHGYHDLAHCAEVAMLKIELLKYVGSKTESERDAALALAADRLVDADRFKKALEKISVIRNNIVDTQSIGWSRHIYPLVAALDEVGIDYEIDAARAAS